MNKANFDTALSNVLQEKIADLIYLMHERIKPLKFTMTMYHAIPLYLVLGSLVEPLTFTKNFFNDFTPRKNTKTQGLQVTG